MSQRWLALRWLGVILVVVVSFSVTGYCADETIALDSVHKAAEQGDAIAQFNLSSMYCYGRGVPKNYIKAYAWLSLASAQMDKDASSVLDNLTEMMTPEQIAKAQKEAAVMWERIQKQKQEKP